MVAVGRDAFLLKGELVSHHPEACIEAGDAVLCCLLRSAPIFLRVGNPILESVNPLDAGLLILVPGFDVGAFGKLRHLSSGGGSYLSVWYCAIFTPPPHGTPARCALQTED